jgi:MinD superfamily P-loop ATPase
VSSLTVCYAVKGGSGTTVVAAAMALTASGDIDLVDIDGQLPAALGIREPSGDGIAEWIGAGLDAAALDLLTVEINNTTRLLPRGHKPIDRHSSRWNELATGLRERRSAVIVDAGTGRPPPPLLELADQTLLVTRPCYLALREAVASPVRPTGVVLVNEPGRALTPTDVERAIGVPVVAQVAYDTAVARAVDAGMLAARLPNSLHHSLQPTVASLDRRADPRHDVARSDVAHDIVQHRQHAAPRHEPPPLDVA